MKLTLLCFNKNYPNKKKKQQPTIDLYTDGSKDENKFALIAVINYDIFLVRLQDEATIYTAELYCIQNQVNKPYNFNLICQY